MRATLLWRMGLAAALLALAAPTPRADPPPVINYGGLLAKKPPKAQMPEVRAPPVVWPRLDRGVVICRTEADLLRRAAALRGESDGGANCRSITAPTPITIVARHGVGRTEVKLTDRSNETAWTDAWLPANPPGGPTTVAR